MTKDELSKVSWIALRGLAVAVLGTLAGLSIAGRFVADNDDALVSGLTWGVIAGVVLGGVAVGLGCGRAGVFSRRPLLASAVAPGTLISIPLLVVVVVGQEWAALRWVVLFVSTSSVAAALATLLARRPTAASM